MAISDGIVSYLATLERQKALIVQLGSNSGIKIPGLNVDSVIENLAQLNSDLQQTYEYYDSQAEVEASNEEQKAAEAGIVETEEQKKARRDAKKQEAKKKRQEVYDKYKKSLEDFVQEQISIIETSAASVEEGHLYLLFLQDGREDLTYYIIGVVGESVWSGGLKVPRLILNLSAPLVFPKSIGAIAIKSPDVGG